MRMFILACAIVLSLISAVRADTLQISPVSIELTAPANAVVIRLRNDAALPLDAQVRVFQWRQVDGVERLEPTTDVIASPPAVTLAAKTVYTVRVVRIAKRAIAAAENYRVIVDELPGPATRKNGSVALVLRYSVPVFLVPPDARQGAVSFSVESENGQPFLKAENGGDRHIRLSDVQLEDASGARVSLGAGLLGYVLGRSTMRWMLPSTSRLRMDRPISVKAQSNYGPVHAAVRPAAAR